MISNPYFCERIYIDLFEFALIQLVSSPYKELSIKILHVASGPFSIAYLPPSFSARKSICCSLLFQKASVMFFLGNFLQKKDYLSHSFHLQEDLENTLSARKSVLVFDSPTVRFKYTFFLQILDVV